MFPHHRRCRLDHECTPEITQHAWKDGHCWRLVAGAVPAQKQGTGKEDYVRETARPGSLATQSHEVERGGRSVDLLCRTVRVTSAHKPVQHSLVASSSCRPRLAAQRTKAAVMSSLANAGRRKCQDACGD